MGLTATPKDEVDVNTYRLFDLERAALLYESPFTDFTPSGPEGLFGSAQVDELLAVLSQIRAAALAA